ncbi:unnamed protein product [Chrysodeixis includens]|uniref:Peptidase M14 domain-containing protein n=1 Tax=Chrysodeixis includens TaxID=689277 RepID=A0A9P0BV60_CHRIL|nr:unnamed protein product [Chrysodeixis includens]
MALYLDIHSYGSLLLYGFGNGNLPPNALTVHVIGVNMVQAIDKVKWEENKNYQVGNVVHILYAASGGAMDYAVKAGAQFAYTFELPAYKNKDWLDGFLVDPDFIEQAGFETWEGIKVGARSVARSFSNRVQTV